MTGTDDDAEPRWRSVNRAMWDEAAPLHAASAFYDLAGFVGGRDSLHPFEPDELGPVDGLDLVHLQCHLGTDTLSWARRGARVVGLDFSAPALDAARDLARRCHADAEFVASDVYDAVDALGHRRFDVVYTGMGALVWLPDLPRWASVVHDLLVPGGVLYLVEIHPVVGAVDRETGRTITSDMVGDAFRAFDEPGGTYAVPDATLEHTVTYERLHGVGEAVSALLDAGLALELLHEHSVTHAPLPWLVPGGDGLRRVAPGAPRVPLTYSLRARRAATP
jgi:SAM-dependent methyltransferase